jgi:hypothetical protein
MQYAVKTEGTYISGVKVQNGTFGFQGHGRSVDFFGGKNSPFCWKKSPSDMVKELFGHFSEKFPHFKEEIYEMAKLLGNKNNSWQIW